MRATCLSMQINTSWHGPFYKRPYLQCLQGKQECDDMLKFCQALTMNPELNPPRCVIALTGL
jgi:hypothetical protein